jgi:ABC-type uncharacterized transport system auxiliary subunit
MSEKKIVMKYYTIEIPSGMVPVSFDSVPVIKGSCQIDQVQVNQLYDKNQIVNRSGSNEVSFYKYHQWALRPSEAVKELVLEYVGSSGLFQSLTSGYSRSVPWYRFSTTLTRLELIEDNRSFSVSLDIEFRLIDNSDESVILRHEADRTKALKGKNLNLFAIEVSNIICGELSVFVKSIEENRFLFSGSP